ncbi:MAG: hypothetical protein A3A24_01355 [Candidatus Buchananbacteria bacterium RIFCSPLOWO2_01_FULL_46_12]|uniref:Uncharacterized protein n=1 Tax=Candidatus Buchananbacteria bacterium RIFCSPLOWO2_01_FULL_46_12 TaxID=1797546 RepID=A0A1G1YST9_9BACT|nr:MAG: hypothetical protein A3A24_01355 [Candidatus Buchananbacteria bacterium RIFCSPLOWO2_01_FULL_46_12]
MRGGFFAAYGKDQKGSWESHNKCSEQGRKEGRNDFKASKIFAGGKDCFYGVEGYTQYEDKRYKIGKKANGIPPAPFFPYSKRRDKKERAKPPLKGPGE